MGGGWRGWNIGCRCSKTAWRPLFDHFDAEDVDRDRQCGDPGGRGTPVRHCRLSQIRAFNRRGRRRAAIARSPPMRCTLAKRNSRSGSANWPVHRTKIFAEPDSANALDFGFASARDFAPERARGDNVYEAAASYLKAARQGRQTARSWPPIRKAAARGSHRSWAKRARPSPWRKAGRKRWAHRPRANRSR